MPSEIEFIDDDNGSARQDEDQLEFGSRPRLRRWGVVVGAAVAAGVIVAAITLHGDERPQAALSASSPTPAPASDRGHIVVPAPSRPLRAPTTAFAMTLNLDHGDVQAVAPVGDGVVVLEPGYLARIGYRGATLNAAVGRNIGLPVGAVGDPSYAHWTLVSDGHNLWTVGGQRVYRINQATMALGPMLQPPGEILDSAALDGHLYLDTDVGVYRAQSSAYTVSTQEVTRGGHAMAADPTRHRLLLIDHDNSSAVRGYSPTEQKTSAYRTLPFNAQSVIVVGGAIWVSGTSDDGGPVLARLDPTTLRVISRSTLAPQLSEVPTLIEGRADMWVRGGAQLWCVNARSGAVAQHWGLLPGPVASHGGRAFVADRSVVGQLRLNGACTG